MKLALRSTAFSAIAFLACTTASQAELTTQAVVDSLTASGYTATEITTYDTTVRAEATNGTDRIEVVYDRSTGAVLSQEVSGSDGRRGGRSTGSTDDPVGHDVGDDHGSDGHGADDSGPDDHGSDGHGSDDSGSDDHGSDDSGSDDSGSDDSGSDDSGSDDSGSGGHGSDD